MIITVPYNTRKDGVRLFLTIDVVVDEHGVPLYDENQQLIPTGLYIIQNETQCMYSVAIDVENAPFTYSNSNIPIPTFEEGK